MDINQVKFGNYSIANSQANLMKQRDAKSEEKPMNEAKGEEGNKLGADEVFGFLDAMGRQMQVQVKGPQTREVKQGALNALDIDPSKYLTDDRIGDIEAAMDFFSNGTKAIADAFEAEFPGHFGAAEREAFAAQWLAQRA